LMNARTLELIDCRTNNGLNRRSDQVLCKRSCVTGVAG
jgi:hypothetical protein